VCVCVCLCVFVCVCGINPVIPHPLTASLPPQGFNRSFAGQNATAYGKGVYFAVNASYSAGSTYRHAHHTRVLNPTFRGMREITAS
jgi:hypothetical protein